MNMMQAHWDPATIAPCKGCEEKCADEGQAHMCPVKSADYHIFESGLESRKLVGLATGKRHSHRVISRAEPHP